MVYNSRKKSPNKKILLQVDLMEFKIRFLLDEKAAYIVRNI